MYHASVRRLLLTISPVLHLTRVTSAFAAIANVWMVILWTRAVPEELAFAPEPMRARSIWLLLLGGALAALGLYAFAAAVNDLLDVRRDRALRPTRPLVTGRVGQEVAIFVIAGTLIIAVMGATVFGNSGVVLTLVLAAAILVFNASARFVPAVGLLMLGLIYAGHMLVPNPSLRFLMPVWLVMTHSLAVACARHVLSNKVPRLSRRAAVAAVAGWLAWTIVIFAFADARSGDAAWGVWPAWVMPTAAIGPAILLVAFPIVVWRKVARHGLTPKAAEKIGRYGALWLALYGCAWLLGQMALTEAAILGALTVVGIVGMTGLRELYGLAEQPIGFRR